MGVFEKIVCAVLEHRYKVVGRIQRGCVEYPHYVCVRCGYNAKEMKWILPPSSWIVTKREFMVRTSYIVEAENKKEAREKFREAVKEKLVDLVVEAEVKQNL